MSAEYDYEYSEDFNGYAEEEPQNPMYRVTHFPQVGVGVPPFVVYLRDLEEAVRVSDLLGMYDAFQFNHHIKPDYANMTIVGEFDEDDQEWYDLDEYEINDKLLGRA